MTEILNLNNVSLSLPSRAGLVEILKNVSFAALAGEAIGIIGPSGSGKTSLLMVASGLEAVSAGKIEACGFSFDGQSEQALARFRRDNIGIIFQSFHLIPTMTALENVSLPAMIGARSTGEAARESLEAVGLADRMQHLPAELSGGEQQRVAIARALTNDPDIIFADEPTGNLDSKTGDVIVDLLLNLARERNKTLLVVTHATRLARRGDRQLQIGDGVLQ